MKLKPSEAMRINLISHDNGVGLTQDVALLRGIFEAQGWTVNFIEWKDNPRVSPWANVNIHIELLGEGLTVLAPVNILLPNPEWFEGRWARHLSTMTVFAKSQAAKIGFSKQGKDVVFTGFTSRDMYDPKVGKQRKFFHLAGKSTFKQTETLLEAWRKRPDLPQLTVLHHPSKTYRGSAPNIHKISRTVPDEELVRLMNSHRFHICPSAVEGFGHYINEGASTGAVVITTDASPMNELIESDRGILLKPFRQQVMNRTFAKYVRTDEILRGVDAALALPESECMRMGAAAREWFLKNDERFRREVVDQVLAATRRVTA